MLSNELKIVGRAVPELATRYLDKVEKLGEILGQVHDLDCAAATAERHPRWFGSEADCEAVRGLVAEHRVVLEREAFALAAGVFAGRAARRARAGRDRLGDLAQARGEGRRGRDRTGGLMTGATAARRRDDRWRRSVLALGARRAKRRVRRPAGGQHRVVSRRARAAARAGVQPGRRAAYVALSTSDEVAVVDPARAPPRVLARKQACGFPDAIAALPGGGALVACRFDPGPAPRSPRRGAAIGA